MHMNIYLYTIRVLFKYFASVYYSNNFKVFIIDSWSISALLYCRILRFFYTIRSTGNYISFSTKSINTFFFFFAIFFRSQDSVIMTLCKFFFLMNLSLLFLRLFSLIGAWIFRIFCKMFMNSYISLQDFSWKIAL